MREPPRNAADSPGRVLIQSQVACSETMCAIDIADDDPTDPMVRPRVTLSTILLDRLCTIIDLPIGENRRILAEQVTHVAETYLRWRKQAGQRLELRKQRDILIALKNELERCEGNLSLVGSLEQLDEQTRFLILLLRPAASPGTEEDTLVYLHQLGSLRLYEGVCRLFETLFPTSKVKTGPLPLEDLGLIVELLAHVYTNVTGKAPTHSPYSMTKYVAAPQSPFGRFVAAIIEQIDPTIRPTQLDTAMARLIRTRRR